MTKQTKLWALLVAAALVSPAALFLLAGVAGRLAEPDPGVIREAPRAEVSGDESAIRLAGEPSERSAGRRRGRRAESVATSSRVEAVVAAPAPETVTPAPPDDGSEGDDDGGGGRGLEPARAGEDEDDGADDDDDNDDGEDEDDDSNSSDGDGSSDDD